MSSCSRLSLAVYALMFLALQHSTYAAIHDLVPRAFMVLEAAVLLLFNSEEFLRRIQGENLAWSTAIVLVFFEQNEDFLGRKY